MNSFWKSVITLVSGTVLAQAIGIFTTPLVSRLYSPKAFGEYAVIVSVAAVITQIVALGLHSAVMAPSDDNESKEIFTVSYILIVTLSTLFLIFMLVMSPLFRIIRIEVNYILTSFLIYGFVLINSLVGLLYVYVNRRKLNTVLFFNALISALSTLCITIPLGMLGFESTGLVIASLSAGVLSILQMLYHVNPFKKIGNITTIKNVISSNKQFILYQYPSNIIENFAIQLPIQTLSYLFGNTNLGSYSMNEKILGIPSRLIGAPINTIYFRTATEYQKEGKNLADFTFSLITKIMLIWAIIIIITIFFGEPLFGFVLGAQWREAGRLAGFLVLQYAFMFCATSTSYLRVVIGKQKTNLVVSVLRFVMIGISILLGVIVGKSLFNTILFFSLGSSLFLIVDMTINFYCLGSYWVKYIIFSLLYVLVVVILWLVSLRFFS